MLCLSHATAINFWRAVGSGEQPFPSRIIVSGLLDCVTTEKAVLSMIPENIRTLSSKVDFLVPGKQMVHASKRIRAHVCSACLPASSFFRLSDQLLVSSPELCFLQAAHMRRNSRIALAELGMELTGGYSLNDAAKRGFTSHKPLTNVAALRSFIDACHGVSGMGRAREALAFMSDGSVSPRETQCNLALTLPGEHGGYDFAKPECNARVDVNGDDRRLTEQEYFSADRMWRGAEVIFEYDGDTDHGTKADSDADKNRRGILAALGKKVIVCTGAEASDYWRFDRKAEQLARALGFRLPLPDDDEISMRMRLQGVLFNPSHHYRSEWTAPLHPKKPCGTFDQYTSR